MYLWNLGLEFIQISDKQSLADGELSIGMTRYDATPLNTSGNVVNVKLTIPANARPGYFKLYTLVQKANDKVGNPIIINSLVDSVLIYGTNQGIAPVIGNVSNMLVSPNPFINNVNIEYTLGENSQVSADIYDVNGKKLVNLCSDESQIAGNHIYAVDANKYNLSGGVYFLRMNINGQVFEQKIVCVKE